MRFLALGDSYTIGQGVAESERWPVQLAARLKPRHPRLDAPEIVARTGWTTDELSEAIDRAAPRGPYDLVSLLIGVNDQYRGRGSETFREPFRALLTRAITFAGGEPRRVLVLSIPDWGVTPFAGDRDRAKIAREIDAFNAAAREETQRTGARWIDVTGVSREAAGEPSLLAGDGLHPSGIQYARWAELALPAAIELLSARKADGAPGR